MASKLLRDVPFELVNEIRLLAPPRAHAVLNARGTWIAAGLSPQIANELANNLIRKMSKKRLANIKRASGTPIARAAGRLERPMSSVILDAVKRAQSSLLLTKLEHALANRVTPWELLDPMIDTLSAQLNG